MGAATLTGSSQTGRGTEAMGVSLPLDALQEPGTYVCNWSGHLLRVPEADRGTNRFSAADGRHASTWTVTRISANPRISRQEAKTLADGLGLITSF